jgi:Collagen triple helix repeat (20 copies)
MPARIKIDQVGLPPGTPGVARTDGLDTGATVTLENVGSEGLTEFRLLWGPPDDTTAEMTLGPTGDPDVWTFAPTAGSYGTYIIELVENGIALERRIFGVRTPGKGLLIPGLNEAASKTASWLNDGSDQIELSQNNAVDFLDPDLNDLTYAGWWRATHELYRAVEEGVGAPGPTGPTGPAGEAGASGAPGAQGPTGATGQAGAVGSPGPAGADGNDGNDGAQGATGGTGPQGATGPQPTGYAETFAAASSWTVNHNLGRYPAGCSVHSLGGLIVDAEIQHMSVNQIIVRFDAPMAGAVELI